jgi:hypothetical protein
LQQATLNAFFSPAAAGAHRSTRMAMAAAMAQEEVEEARVAQAATTAISNTSNNNSVTALMSAGAVSPPLTQPDNDIVLSMEF